MIEVSKVNVALEFADKISNINAQIDKEQNQLKADKEVVDNVTDKVKNTVSPIKDTIVTTKDNIKSEIANAKNDIKNTLETLDTITDVFLSEPTKQAKQQNKELKEVIKEKENIIDDILEDISLTEENVKNTFNRKIDINNIDENTKEINEQAIKGVENILNQSIKITKANKRPYVEDIMNKERIKKPFNITHNKRNKNQIYNDIINDNLDIFAEKKENEKNE